MNSDRTRLTALAVTVLLHLAVALLLASLYLRHSSEAPRPEWPPADSSEILLGGEYVRIGDTPLPNYLDQPAANSVDQPSEPDMQETLLTTEAESPAQASPNPNDVSHENPGPTAEELERQKKADQIKSRVAFGSGTGSTGQPDGNSDDGAASGVSASGLGNRRIISLPEPQRGPLGRILITIKVDRQGNVTQATFLSGEGAAAASAASRENCLKAAQASRFSEAPSAPATQTGTLTYIFR